MSTKLKQRLRILALFSAALALLLLIGWVVAPFLLVVDSGIHSVNAEVVLGGEPWTRPTRAAEVYQEILAANQKVVTPPSAFRPLSSALPLVIVSGNGDCEDVRRQMQAKGVPPAIIVTECQSRTTQENALFSVKLLRERGVTNAVIVTSWYHSRRALACFQKAAPEITFYSRPTQRPPGLAVWANRYERGRFHQEYGKLLYYWVTYGVSPFL